MRHFPRDANFLAKAPEQVGVARQVFWQELDRDRVRQQEVLGAVDLAHAAFA
jgi:hypothetical protein